MFILQKCYKTWGGLKFVGSFGIFAIICENFLKRKMNKIQKWDIL